MVASPLFNFAVITQGHNLAHVIGRTLAQHYNLAGEAFLLCPTDYAYGCNHGFFEIALVGTEGNQAEAVRQICENLPAKPLLGKSSCYHGAGHGIMMTQSHKLYDALSVCDELPFSRVTCYDGVFMEHISGSGRPEVTENWFDDKDPLAPCSIVEDKYKYACYHRHGNYLFHYYNYSYKDVIDACLDAGSYVERCLTAVSGSVSLSSYREKILPPEFDKSFIDTTLYLCDQFPKDYVYVCYATSAGEMTLFYGVETAWNFCAKVDEANRERCLNAIWGRVYGMTSNETEKRRACDVIPEEHRQACFSWGKTSDELPETEASRRRSFFRFFRN